MKKRLLQAYKQSPWRVQMQWIGLFLLGLVLVAAITGIYLSISAQAAAAGRNIQSLDYQINEINDEISDLTTDLASAQSTDKMMTRAKELGFRMLNPSEAVYMEVPGLDPDAELELAPPRVNVLEETPLIQPTYKSSLWDWFVSNIWLVSGDAIGGGN
jgi:cell division protein FtsL